MGTQYPETAPAPGTACKQDLGRQEQGRVKAGEHLSALPPQSKGVLWDSQEHAGTLLHNQIPGEWQGEPHSPRGCSACNWGGWDGLEA